MRIGRPAIALLGAVLATGAAVAVQAPAQAAPTYAVESTKATVPVRDGVTLSATVQQPAVAPPPGTRWPVLIMPGTFAGDSEEIDRMAARAAARGYVTVSYTERGFGHSTGYIDAGGPDDVADASDALTWALANLAVDADRVGILSISYGAGFGPIVAAQDPRFKAVGMLSGWGDMWKSRYPNRTGAYASNLALQLLSNTSGRPAPALKAFFDNATRNVFTPQMQALAAERSPVTYLDLMRKNPVPLYVSTNMNESIWPEDQTVEFFDAYPGVKHLDILPGDHAASELGQKVGRAGLPWQAAFDWMDTYVAGTSDVSKGLPPVRVAPRSPSGPNVLSTQGLTQYAFEGYPTLAVRATRRQYLSTSSGLFGLIRRTTLTGTPGGGDGTRLRQGRNLLVNYGIPMFAGDLEVLTGTPSTVFLPAVDQGVTGLWEGPALTGKLQLRGAIASHLELTPSTATGSVFVYLLEQSPLGTTYVIGMKPYTYVGVTPGAKLGVDVTIPYNAYDVPAGHRLVFAVSTDDVTFSSNTPTGSTVVVGPNSYVDLPLR